MYKVVRIHLSDLFAAFQCVLSWSKWDGTVWSFTLSEYFAVIFPILKVCCCELFNTYWKPNRAMSADLSFLSLYLVSPPSICNIFHFLGLLDAIFLSTLSHCCYLSWCLISWWEKTAYILKTISEAGISTLKSSCCTIWEILHTFKNFVVSSFTEKTAVVLQRQILYKFPLKRIIHSPSKI